MNSREQDEYQDSEQKDWREQDDAQRYREWESDNRRSY